MSDPIKIACIVGGAIVAAVALWTYFSPYHSCVRAEREHGSAEIACAAALGGR